MKPLKAKFAQFNVRWLLVVLTILVVILMAGSVLSQLGHHVSPRGTYTLHFHRVPAAGPARDALDAAEFVNYSAILDWMPYWSYDGDVMVPTEFETWVNFISNETLDFLMSRIDYMNQSLPWLSATVEYNGAAYWMLNLTIQYTSLTEVVSASNATLSLTFPWEFGGDETRTARWNGSAYGVTIGNQVHPLVGDYGDAFLVYMELTYYDILGSRVGQFVVLNATHHVLTITTANWGNMIS